MIPVRIEALERRVRELEQRIQELETRSQRGASAALLYRRLGDCQLHLEAFQRR